MRAGNLDRVIQIQRIVLAAPDPFGSVAPTWTTFATMRAQKLENAITDREGTHGDTTDNTITFRLRFLGGVGLTNRIMFEGQPFKITSIKEIGRRVALDITCERVGP